MSTASASENAWIESFRGIRRRECLAFRDMLSVRLIVLDKIEDDLFQCIVTNASRMIDIQNAFGQATGRLKMDEDTNDRVYDECREIVYGYIRGTVALPPESERRDILRTVLKFINLVYDREC